MRKKLIAGNWKMNMSAASIESFANEMEEYLQAEGLTDSCRMAICPPYVYIPQLLALGDRLTGIDIGAQNCHWLEHGAFTGEVSADMLIDLGAYLVIIGHSERRDVFHERAAQISHKMIYALEKGLEVIYCCGENIVEREAGNHLKVVEAQLDAEIGELSTDQVKKLVIAYEPVWAIGTGRSADQTQIGEMHGHIRNWMRNKWGEQIAESIPILYGGSCKPGNALEIFTTAEVDGGLIGGASLNAEDFWTIYKVASRI